jgi:arylsulfatase A-like enzyme
VVVVVDGLRPDAVTETGMPNLFALMRRGWHAERAVTVRPSVTVAALTSLATGVSPARHGIRDSSPGRLPRLRGLRPLPLELRRLGVGTTVLTPELPAATRWAAGALLRLGGVGRLVATTSSPAAIVQAAIDRLAGNTGREFVVVYLNDADLAGHAWGWMSAAYLQAARQVDTALARLMRFCEDPESLVIITADHGGGGVLATDHDHPHPANDLIPLALMSGRVAPGLATSDPVTLLDIPPTVLHGFGGTAPAPYEGRVIHEAFVTELVWS